MLLDAGVDNVGDKSSSSDHVAECTHFYEKPTYPASGRFDI